LSKKLFILLVALLFILILFGCTAEQSNKDPWSLDMVTSMGGSQGDPTVQELEYRIDIAYIGSDNVEIVNIIPLFSDKPAVSAKITEESQQVVEKESTNMSIKGKLIVSTGSLTKKQIEEIGPFITGITISWQESGQIHETTKILH